MKKLETLKPPNDLHEITGGKYDMPNSAYHSMRWTLSSSGARNILKSPIRFHYEQEHPKPQSKAFEDGTLWHAWMLEGGKNVEFVDAKNWLTKAAKQAKEDIKARGMIPALMEDKTTLEGALRALMSNPDAADLLNPLEGEAEASYFTTDPETGVLLRTRPDWLTWKNGKLTIVDYKTTTDATPEGFTKSAASFGYHQQAAWYLDQLKTVYGVNNAEFVFIAQEKEPPYLTGVYTLDMPALLEGQNANREAIDLFARYERDGWPEFCQGRTELSLPSWAFRRLIFPTLEPTIKD